MNFKKNCRTIIRLFKIKREASFLRNFVIQTRLIVSFLFLSIVPLTITGIVSYTNSSNAINSKISIYSTQIINRVSEEIKIEEEKIEETQKKVILNTDTIQEDLGLIKNGSIIDRINANRKISDYLVSKFSDTDEIQYSGILTEDGNTLGSAKQFDAAEIKLIFALYKKQSAKSVWTAVQNPDNTTSYANIREFGAVNAGGSARLSIVAIKSSLLGETYKDINFGKGSNIYVIDSDGTVLSSADKTVKELEPYKDQNIMKTIFQNEKNNKFIFDCNINGSKALVTYSHVENTDWYVIGTIPYSYLNAESNNIRNNIIVISLVCILLAVLLSFIIARSISIPSNKLATIMKEAKNGNLTIYVQDSSKDEIGQVITNFNDMLSNMKRLVWQARESAQMVIDSGKQITSSSSQSYTISEQIAGTIQHIAKGASDQASEIVKGVGHLTTLSDGINKVADSMSHVAEVVQKTHHLSEKAFDTVKSLDNRAAQTRAVSENIMNEMNSFSSDMNEIDKIVKLIVEIAEQTNLLSLNAAIEAARAGEAGKSFAVVAREVQKLAEQSRKASITISDILNSIKNKTKLTVKAARDANDIVNLQLETVDETDKAFKTIYQSMENINKSMNFMEALVKEILTSKEKALETIENVSAVSEEAAATAEEVSASTQEQMAFTDKLFNLAKKLDQMAQELSSAISTFKVE